MPLLDTPYPLTDAQVAFYQQNRYIKLKQVFNAATIAELNGAITQHVNANSQAVLPLAERDTYGKAFLQLYNLWQHLPVVRALVLSPRLGQLAAQLMQVKGVRLYHDQALFKEPGGGITPWHADQHYWPLSTDKTITAWVPLQATPLAMGPLEFSAASHQLITGRNLKISDHSEATMQQQLRLGNFKHVIEPFDVGEVSFHSGWVFHRAGANTTRHVRKVMTAIYMDSAMVVKQPENKYQQADLEKWCPGATPGGLAATPLNPMAGKPVAS